MQNELMHMTMELYDIHQLQMHEDKVWGCSWISGIMTNDIPIKSNVELEKANDRISNFESLKWKLVKSKIRLKVDMISCFNIIQTITQLANYYIMNGRFTMKDTFWKTSKFDVTHKSLYLHVVLGSIPP